MMAEASTNGRRKGDDPTENVLLLVDAANQRQDDLRDLSYKLTDARIRCMEQITILRADHAKEIRGLESDRLDKIRQVDVLAGNTAADRALVAIQTLASVTTANAETLRAMVASTATAIAAQTATAMAAVTERIAALEKSSFVATGKQAVADPQMERLASMVEQLARNQASGTGKSQGISDTWKLIIAAIGLAATLNALGVFARWREPAAAPAPIYVPAPSGTTLPSIPPQTVPR